MLAKIIRKKFIKFKDSFRTIGRIFSYVLNYKFQVSIIFLSTIIVAIASTVGTAFLKIIIDKYIEPLIKNPDRILLNGFIRILLIMAIIYLIGTICVYLSNRLTVNVIAKTLCKIRKELFEKMEKSSLEYFDGHKHGELMSLYTNDIDTLREMLTQTFTSSISSILTIIGAFAVMFYYSWQLTLIAMLVVFIAVFFTKKIVNRGSKYFTEQQNELAKLNGFVEEMVEGQKVIKVFCHEELAKEDFKKINSNLCDVSTKAAIYTIILYPLSINILSLNYILMAIIGSIFITKSIITIGTLIPFLIYVRAIVDPVIDLMDQMAGILSALAGGKRIFKVIDREPETDNGTIAIEEKEGELFLVGNNIEKKVEGTIKFENVWFSYNGKKSILKSIDLEVKRGEKIALVGSTGAGKTTITSVLNRFYDIQNGKIMFDGINVESIKKSNLRKMFSMVLQDTHLFTDTIRENIRYGRPDATDSEVEKAAELANADKFILSLPNGYDTMLTSDATNLSQGERQLLNIARAIVSNRQVLILDEATSSIDTKTESLIDEAIDNLIKNKTVFIIAHRLSTVRNADKIVVLENGGIIEQGNHEELLKNKGRYYQLCNGTITIE